MNEEQMNDLLEKAEKGDKRAIIDLIKYLLAIDKGMADRHEELIAEMRKFMDDVKAMGEGKPKEAGPVKGEYIS